LSQGNSAIRPYIEIRKMSSQKIYKLNKITMTPMTHTGLPQLAATTFGELSEIIRIRSNRYPTNYMDLLFLENENKKLSDILTLFQDYRAKNNDFKTVSRIKVHIRYRENHDGWIFKYSGDSKNPIVRLTGLK
jgi:hypothetical protein